MKRMLLTAFAAVLLLAPAANAQKVNDAALRQKLSKSDADIQDAKKAAKSATWLNRGKVYFETLQAPVRDLGAVDQFTLKLYMGDPQTKSDDVWEYPWVTVYFKNGEVCAWEQTKFIYDKSAGDVALEALTRAYEIDPKQASKIKTVLEQIVNYYNDVGYYNGELQHFDVAIDAYEKVFKAQSNPAYGTPNYEYLYYAGYYATFLGATDPAMYVKGEELLTKAIENGFTDANGEIYYYLFHSRYGQKDADASKVVAGQQALLEGIVKFPKNEHILDGLIQLYTSADGVGDPADLVEIVDNVLKESPDNADLWISRGKLFYKLNNLDESLASFHKAAELKPDTFENNNYLGVIYTVKGDRILNDMPSHDFKSQSEYDAELDRALDAYKQAVPWYEKALSINPDDVDTVETLKSICFRLRDSGGEYMPKYEHYNTLYKQMKGLE